MKQSREDIIMKALRFKKRAYDEKSTDAERQKAIEKFNALVLEHGINRYEILRVEKLQNSPSFSCFGEKFKDMAEFKSWFMKLNWGRRLVVSFKLIFRIEKIKKTVDVEKKKN